MTRMRTKQVSASQILPDIESEYSPRTFLSTTTGTTQGFTQSESSPSGYSTDATDGYATDTTADYETDTTATATTRPFTKSFAPSAAHVDALLEDEMAFGYRPTIGNFKIFTYKHQAPFFV